jgi:hypothetical protein
MVICLECQVTCLLYISLRKLTYKCCVATMYKNRVINCVTSLVYQRVSRYSRTMLPDPKERSHKTLTEENLFTTFQNPQNCSSARKLVCNLNVACGYGCQLHHATFCLLMAYGTQRTLILETDKSRYASSRVWETCFQPLSNTCTSRGNGPVKQWKGECGCVGNGTKFMGSLTHVHFR